MRYVCQTQIGACFEFLFEYQNRFLLQEEIYYIRNGKYCKNVNSTSKELYSEEKFSKRFNSVENVSFRWRVVAYLFFIMCVLQTKITMNISFL